MITPMRIGVAVLMGLALTACQQDANPKGEAETHWLEQCGADADCGAGICVCGVCTEACDAEGVCDEEARPACANVQRLAQICGEPVAVCVRECAAEADCGAGDFACRDGVCVAADAPVPADPEPLPPDEECTEACDRLARCFDLRCFASLPPAVDQACRTGCAQVGVAEWGRFGSCREAVGWVEDAYPDFEPGCDLGVEPQPEPDPPPEPEPSDECAEICAGMTACFNDRCPEPLPDLVAQDCQEACERLGPAEWGAPLQTCDGTLRFLRDSYPDLTQGCDFDPGPAPVPPACVVGCERLADCAVEQCFDVGDGAREALAADCGAWCAEDQPLQVLLSQPLTCEEVVERARAIEPGFRDVCGEFERPCGVICDGLAVCYADACGRALPAQAMQGCRWDCGRLGPAEWGDRLGDCDAALDLVGLAWPEAAAACRAPAPDCGADLPLLEADRPTRFDTVPGQVFEGEGCGTSDGTALSFRVTLEAAATVTVSADSNFDSVLFVHPNCDVDAQICRDDGIPNSLDARVTTPLDAGTHTVTIAGFNGQAGAGQLLLEVAVAPLVAGCAAVAAVEDGDPVVNARLVAGQFSQLRGAARATMARIADDLEGVDPADIVDAGVVLTDRPICAEACTPADLDRAISDLAHLQRALAPHLDASDAAQEVTRCVELLAPRLARVQRGFIASVCGDVHSTTRAITEVLDLAAPSADSLLCVTRAAHDLCQSRYLGAATLAEEGRCPSCAVAFGETVCGLPADDPCGAAGECLCEAIGAEGEACELHAFGPRGAIAFGEVCAASATLRQTFAVGGFDARGLPTAVSVGCALMPAVLEERQCVPQDVCQRCPQGSVVPAEQCEPGRQDCEIYVECGRRFVAVFEDCYAQAPLCPAGWTPVEVCLDDLPCESSTACGVTVQCQPARP